MNKTVIVTGASRGIGAAIASLFAQEGYNVVLNYLNSENECQRLVNSLNSSGYSVSQFKADVSVPSEADALIEFTLKTYGSVDVLVNNAGIAEFSLFTDISDESWNRMISVNLGGCFNCSRAASKAMLRSHSGSIINISSIWGINGASCEVHYSASKFGIVGLTKSLAKELGPSGIRVNTVAPGVIDTDMSSSLSKETIKEIIDSTPLSRIGTPRDIAEAVFFLASDKASFITGQTLTVDGGFIG